MPAKAKEQPSRNEVVNLLKDFINSANLMEIRLIDIALKERKHEIISNGSKEVFPSIQLYASKIRNDEYICIQEYKDGKSRTRKLKESEVADFNYELVKISPRAKKVLAEKYDIHL